MRKILFVLPVIAASALAIGCGDIGTKAPTTEPSAETQQTTDEGQSVSQPTKETSETETQE